MFYLCFLFIIAIVLINLIFVVVVALPTSL